MDYKLNMTIPEKYLYLQSKGWVHNEEAPIGKRWLSPHEKNRKSFTQALKDQRGIDDGTVRCVPCRSCEKPMLIGPRLLRFEICESCNFQNRNKERGYIPPEQLGSAVRITKVNAAKLKALSESKKKSIQTLVNEILDQVLQP